MSDFRAALGARLQDLRDAAGLTQVVLARKLGIESKYLADLEHGRKRASFKLLERLLTVLNLEPCDLFNFRLKSPGRRRAAPSDEDKLLESMRRSDPARRRLVYAVAKQILQWRGPGQA